MFRQELLSREAVLIDVSAEIMRQGAQHLADYLGPKIDSIAKGSMDV